MNIIFYNSMNRFFMLNRVYNSEAMQLLLHDPEKVLNNNPSVKILKTDIKTTVYSILLDDKLLVIKRYNIKNFWHAIKRAVKPTRAMNNWVCAHRLQLLGVATPKPVAVIERRFGPFRNRAYFISEYVDGILLTDYFLSGFISNSAKQVSSNIKHAFKRLSDAMCSHGDCKATNIILINNEPCFIDLDAMRFHCFSLCWRRAAKRDHARFLENWQDRSDILKFFVMD